MRKGDIMLDVSDYVVVSRDPFTHDVIVDGFKDKKDAVKYARILSEKESIEAHVLSLESSYAPILYTAEELYG